MVFVVLFACVTMIEYLAFMFNAKKYLNAPLPMITHGNYSLSQKVDIMVRDDWQNETRKKTKAELPLEPMRVILKAAGGEGKDAMRAGKDAAIAFRKSIIAMAKVLAKNAGVYAIHSKRETIMVEDVELAAKEMAKRL